MTKTQLLSSLTILILITWQPHSHAQSDDIAMRTDKARAVADELVTTLGSKLKSEMSANGPVEAIDVCRTVAPTIANTLSLQNGWRVTRISHKPRNSMIGLADSWEQTVLEDFLSRANDGEKVAQMEHAEVVQEPHGRFFRYVRALETKPVCLACHGAQAQIPEPVRAQLKANYPYDRAYGFQLGELRGAISIKQPIE